MAVPRPAPWWVDVPDDWVEGDPVPPGAHETDASGLNGFGNMIMDYVDAVVADTILKQVSVLSYTRLGAVSVAAGVISFPLPRAFICTGVKFFLKTPGSSGTTKIAVFIDGADAFSSSANQPSAAAGAVVSNEKAPQNQSWPAGSTIEVDVVTAGTGADQLSVQFIGRWI